MGNIQTLTRLCMKGVPWNAGQKRRSKTPPEAAGHPGDPFFISTNTGVCATERYSTWRLTASCVAAIWSRSG